jgi:hypothetical protein
MSIESNAWTRGYDPYGTHIEALAWALAKAPEGPVLELGGGWFSTPLLRGWCEATGRLLITAERDEAWRAGLSARFADSDGHHLLPGAPTLDWALVLVDSGGDTAAGSPRAEAIRLLRDHAAVLVCHDTEPESRYNYPGMEAALAAWPNRRDFVRLTPQTTVVWA